MIKIRLARTGKKREISYRIVACERRSKRNGKSLDILGFYDPKTKPVTIKINKELLNDWLMKGAQLTPAVKKLINEKTS